MLHTANGEAVVVATFALSVLIAGSDLAVVEGRMSAVCAAPLIASRAGQKAA